MSDNQTMFNYETVVNDNQFRQQNNQTGKWNVVEKFSSTTQTILVIIIIFVIIFVVLGIITYMRASTAATLST